MAEQMTPDECAEFIFKRLFERNRTVGGNSLELTGITGSGKTSLNLEFYEIIAKRYPDELIFWRDLVESPVQFVRTPKWRLFVEKGLNFRINDKYDGGRPLDVPYDTFDELPMVSYDPGISADKDKFRMNQENKEAQDNIFSNIYHCAKGSTLNVIYFRNNASWTDFMRYIRNTPEWVTLFWDEYEDIFPGANRGEDWWRIQWAKDNIKQARKGFVNLFCNTQNKADVDYRIRQKMGHWAYLFGSVPDDDSVIDKRYARHLNIGQGWLDIGHYKFGKFSFPPYHVDPNTMWEVWLS